MHSQAGAWERDKSLQDQEKSTANESGMNLKVQVSIGTAWKASGSANAAQGKGNYQSVNQQSGLFAEDGGYNINVGKNTNLIGGVISSSDKAIAEYKNSLTTGTLTMSDLENHSSYSAEAVAVSGGSDFTKANINGVGAGVEAKSESSLTRSAISQGAITITDGTKQQELSGKTAQETIANINTDTAHAHTALEPLPDLKVLLNKQQAIAGAMLTYSQIVPKAIADYSSAKESDLTTQANNETDPTKKAQLQAEADKWAEGGVYRVTLHTIAGGLVGDIGGALGAGVSAATIPAIGEMINSADLPSEVKQSLVALAGTAIGAAAGSIAGDGGALTGGATGFNQTVNNYLSEGQKDQRTKQLGSCQGNPDCVKPVNDYWNKINDETTMIGKIASDAWSGIMGLADGLQNLKQTDTSNMSPEGKLMFNYLLLRKDTGLNTSETPINLVDKIEMYNSAKDLGK